MDKYLEQIKQAKTKDELHAISYNFLKNEDVTITSKETNLIDGLCVFKEMELAGANYNELMRCIKTLKIPQKMWKKVYSR